MKWLVDRCLALFFLLFIIQCSNPSTESEKLNTQQPDSTTAAHTEQVAEMPESIPDSMIHGNLLYQKNWRDKFGRYLLVVSRTPVKSYARYGEYLQSVQFYAAQYKWTGKEFTREWHIRDGVTDCMSDMWVGLIDSSVFITDLDSNGHSETTIIYKLSCRSDVSPSTMKVIMTEEGKKMQLRGQMTIEQIFGKLDKKQFEPDLSKLTYKVEYPEFGRYRSSAAFNSKPQFLSFARQKWIEYCTRDLPQQF